MPQPRAARQPLGAVRNGSRVKARPLPQPMVSDALKISIDTMEVSRLRMLVRHYCESNTELRCVLERETLVKGKDVVRYHFDNDSEDDVDSEIESNNEEDEEEKSGSENEEREKPLKPILVGDEEFTARYATCEHCKEEFDVSNNTREYQWHTGMRNSRELEVLC